MSGGDIIRSKFLRFLPERPELDFFITEHVRIRGSTDLIFSHHLIYHALLIFRFKIKEKKRNVERDAYFHGITTFVSPFTRQEVRLPHFDKNAGDIKSLRFQKRRTNGG